MKKPKLKTYRVLYAVARSEWYEIKAPDEGTARDLAFSEGKQLDLGDTTDVVDCDVEEVQAERGNPQPRRRKPRGTSSFD
jgi:hypothetical protein